MGGARLPVGRLEARMTEQIPDEPDEPDEQFHRDRREHGGEIDRLDEDRLARPTEGERVEAGADDYDPGEGPPPPGRPPPPGHAHSAGCAGGRGGKTPEREEGVGSAPTRSATC